MRKPYSDETRNDIVEKYILGESVREIHESTGISVGSISEYINDFSSKIDRHTIDAMHDFFKIIRKNGMQPRDAFYGHVVFSLLVQNKLDPRHIHSFIESVLSMAKQEELSAEQLVKVCNIVSAIQSNSDVPLDEIENHCTELVKNKNELQASIDKLSEQYEQSQNNLSTLLKKNKLTEQQAEKTAHTLNLLENFGFDLSDIDSVCNLLQNAKSQGYDVAKIYSRLSQDESLDLTLFEKQSKLDDVEKRIRKLEKKHEDMSLLYENLVLRHDSMTKSIGLVDTLGKKGVSEKDLIAWQKIFDSFGLNPERFCHVLEEIGNKNNLILDLDAKKLKLKKDIAHLEKRKSWLENKSDDISSEISNSVEYGKNNLKKVTSYAEFQINQILAHAKLSLGELIKQNQTSVNLTKNQTEECFLDITSKLEDLLKKSHQAERTLGKMESLKPLHDLINGTFDPAVSIPQIIAILDVLYVKIKGTKLDKGMLAYDIKKLRENLLDLAGHV